MINTRNLSETGRRLKRWPAHRIALGAAFFLSIAATVPAGASSHMDAPLITLDPAANTTDVYAFISQVDGQKYLTTALAVFPFEHPGIGPNTFRFDDRVAYDIHVALDDDIGKGKADLTYRFRFNTAYRDTGTILSFLGLVQPAAPGVFPDNQNLRQTYTVTLIDSRGTERPTFPGAGRLPANIPLPGVLTPPSVTVLGSGMVPPNNQGRVTPFYNQNNDGDQPAKPGVQTSNALDPYTKNTIFDLQRGHRVFAGQRDDGFFADVQSIFDLEFSFGRDRNTPTKPFDSQSGFNVQTIVLNIPITTLGGAKISGVYATTSRAILPASLSSIDPNEAATLRADPAALIGLTPGELFLKQVGRQGNPLFCEIFVAEIDKDRYNQTKPTLDAVLFAKYADSPEVARRLNLTPIPGLLHTIFVPDLIKVDLTTPPARLAGSPDFNRLSVFGGDVLRSTAQGRDIPGGWPNGRRFGDDVENIGLIALGANPNLNSSRVTHNDITYNDVFPYAATPHNGRNIAPSTPNQF